MSTIIVRSVDYIVLLVVLCPPPSLSCAERRHIELDIDDGAVMENQGTMSGFARSINRRQHLSVSVLQVSRSICLRQNCGCAGDLSQFCWATTIDTKA